MRGDTGSAEMHEEDRPLISSRFLVIATLSIMLLAVASFIISWFGQAYGERLALAGHSESTEILDITIGRDRIALPANTIRFEGQRLSGSTERVDLYLLWPDLTGYSSKERRRFDDLSSSQNLVFLQISQSTMSRDMSGRVEPIYRHLLQPEPSQGPAGLTLQTFRDGTGYEGETLLTAPQADGTLYAIRCLLPGSTGEATSSDCQRDIHVGEDLTVLYRFSSRLLGDWQAIDAAVRDYVSSRTTPVAAATTTKNQPKASTDRSS
jgi:hypothetical protein